MLPQAQAPDNRVSSDRYRMRCGVFGLAVFLLCFSSLFGFLVVFFTTCVSPAGFRHVMYDWAFRYVMHCQGVSISARAYRYAVAVGEICLHLDIIY